MIELSPVMAATPWGSGGAFSAKGINLYERGEQASPIAVLDEFRVRGRPFGPHPHAGFSALTYVFEDSQASVRSRDSLGNDVVVGPGGIVWLQAASGALHQEVPAETDRELHGAQIFVNLSSRNKFAPPRTFWLQGGDVTQWRNEAGDRVRVVVGSYDGLSSALVPAEPLDLLDVELRRAISFNLPNGHYALLHVLAGEVRVRGDDRHQGVPAEHAIALRGGGRLTIEAFQSAHFLLLSGAEMHDAIVVDGPFIMNERSQIRAAAERFRAGDMGRLDPLPENEGAAA